MSTSPHTTTQATNTPLVMQAKGLGLRKSGNVLWIAPKDEIQAREAGCDD